MGPTNDVCSNSDDPHVLDFSNRGLKKLEKRDGVGVEKLSLDHNELTKLDNIDCFLDLQKLSATHNQITRMYSLARLSQLSSLDLSNNVLVCIEALKDLKYLVSVNLSNNRIKSLQNIQFSTTLVYLDLSGNLIPSLIDLTSLTRLKTLLLKRNEITTLQKAQVYLPSGLCVFSVAENKITDLTEVSFLSHLSSLESFSIGGNPCVNMTGGIVGFDYRPYVINWCLGLRVLDDFVVTQRESLKAEWLYSQGKGRCFHLGDHLALVEYLSQVCPLTAADQMESEDEERISRILRMQRQHREQLLHEMSPAASFQAACAGDNNNGGGAVASVAQGAPANRTQHCPHGKHHGPSGNRRPKSAVGRLSSGRQTTFVKEKWGDFSASEDERGAASLGYDPFPDLLAHSDEGPVRTSAHCKFSEASELLSSELTRSVIDPRSPLTIERVTDTPHSNERGRQRRSRKDDIMTRSVPEFRSDGSPVLHSYGKSSYGRSSPRAIPVRKVSSKRSSASITTPTDVVLPAGMSSTRSFDGSAVSSSMAASTVAAAGTSRLHHHQRSPSDGGLHRSSSFRTPTGRSPYATVATASPRKGQRSSSVSAISCPPPYSPRNVPSRVPSSRYGNVPAVQPAGQNNLNITTTINHNNNQQQQQQNIHNNNNNSAALLVESDPLLKQRSQAVGLEVLDRAAVKIQALWRGYRARAHMDKVHKVCQEVRLRRLEECVLDIQSKLTRVNEALLKQQKELEEERKYRTSNNEALNKLLTNMEQLEGHITKMFHQQLVQQQQLSLREKATFKPICNEPQTTESSSSSSSEVTVGNGASTSSSAPKAPSQCAAAPKEEQCPLPPTSQERLECRNGAGFNLSPEQTSLDGTSADDTTCTSMSEGEVRPAEVGPDEICSGKARPSEAHSGVEDAAQADRGTTLQAEPGAEENAESACLLALNNRLARLEAVIMKLAIPDPSLLLGSAFTNP